MLLGERAAGSDPQMTQNIRFWPSIDASRAVVSPASLASVALAGHISQPYIATGPKATHMEGQSVAHWRELVLRTWNSPDTNVCISTERSPSSAENWVIHGEPDWMISQG